MAPARRESTRILVTGSRNHRDRRLVFTMLDRVTAALCPHEQPGRIVLVHGDAPGADRLALTWARLRGVRTEGHPADWYGPCRADQCAPRHRRRDRHGRTYCPAEGGYRNQAMVDLGARGCLAFPMTGSVGTWDCVRRARTAGIPTEVVDTDRTRRLRR